MNTRLVLWGEIGTDRQALITIHLVEETAKIYIHAFPKEEVTKDLQDALFAEWKNGGDFSFPENAIRWEVDANTDTILPEEVKVERPEIILQSQHKWSKKLMSARINQLLEDEIKLLDEKADTLAAYDQTLWDKTKAQWEKISLYQKKNEISWEQTTALKDKINRIFDALKAVKRLHHEQEDQANVVLVKNLHQRVEELRNKLIYPDQWKYIFDELKKMQGTLKDVSIRWAQKRQLYNEINAIFDDLKKYRMTETINKTNSRIAQLTKILGGLKDSLERDAESYKSQVEKMQHYTRGKLSEEELQTRFSHLHERIKEKEQKIAGIQQTIKQLKDEIQKEKKQQEQREQQRLKREQEMAEKQEEETPVSENIHDTEHTEAAQEPSSETPEAGESAAEENQDV